MSKELTSSTIERQNVLNNPFAVTEIQKAIHIRGVVFEGTVRLVKDQIAAFVEVDVRTVIEDDMCREGLKLKILMAISD